MCRRSAVQRRQTAVIDHDDIPGYMDAMTMPFPIHEDWVWDDLTPGSEVRADLVVDNTGKDPYWLEKVGIVAAPDPNKPAPPEKEQFVQIGKDVPDFQLTNQDGKRISMKDFRGKATALTFIYADCPLPDYCIKMSKNFSDLANQLADDKEAKGKYRLLSISFDPEHDTPAVLKEFGQHAGADFAVWTFATGPSAEMRRLTKEFSVLVQPEKGTISHSLATALIDPQGRIEKIWRGNGWTPAEVVNELQ